MTGSPHRPRRLRYVLVPHPDDEFQAWALLQGRRDLHHVFVLLTAGEATAMCGGGGLQADLGERAPQPQPFVPGDRQRCAAQRLDSWHAFLDGMARVDTAAGDVEPKGEHAGLDVHVGPTSSRVVCDLGDGQLTADVVLDALARTRALRGRVLPDLAEEDVVGAAYWNADAPGSLLYRHPDHRAVHDALWHGDLDLPAWCRTASGDPDAVPPRGLTRHVMPRLYQLVTGLDADGRRTGLLQVVYGWLAFGEAGGAWPVGETDATTLFSRRQSFWRRPAPQVSPVLGPPRR